MKRCSKCKQEKPRTDFYYNNSRGRLESLCKKCRVELYHNAHRAKRLEYAKRYYQQSAWNGYISPEADEKFPLSDSQVNVLRTYIKMELPIIQIADSYKHFNATHEHWSKYDD